MSKIAMKEMAVWQQRNLARKHRQVRRHGHVPVIAQGKIKQQRGKSRP